MIKVKKNVKQFNEDVLKNRGYFYTTNAPVSSVFANKRISTEVFKLISKIKPQSVLDIGCGDGIYTNEIKLGFPDIEVSGFDYSEEAINVACNNYKDMKFYRMDIYKIEDNIHKTYDLCVIRGLLHHLSDPFGALSEVSKICKNIIIVEPNGNNPILKIIEKTSKYHIEHEEQSFSSKLFKSKLSENRLEIEELKFIGFIPYFFNPFLAKVIWKLQPVLEKVYILKKYFGAQIVIYCKR
ncbi:MAG: methyltransferase domain-containing protein [Bacteroidales bacterium]|jgi:ubiquinone/menaquinone biosynthesis C-methylase UbiE|nr:methyltransferase domain-containing protein [Bacteroidales bacterium]